MNKTDDPVWERVSRSELLLHGALLLGAIVIIVLYWNLALPVDGSKGSMLTVADMPSEVELDRHHLMLFVSPTCPYCDQSMPFYSSLSTEVATLRARGVPLSFVAMMDPTESRRAQQHAFASHDVSLDTLITTSLVEIGVHNVPMVALLDADEQRLTTWTGLLGEEEESSVLNQLVSVGRAQ